MLTYKSKKALPSALRDNGKQKSTNNECEVIVEFKQKNTGSDETRSIKKSVLKIIMDGFEERTKNERISA